MRISANSQGTAPIANKANTTGAAPAAEVVAAPTDKVEVSTGDKVKRGITVGAYGAGGAAGGLLLGSLGGEVLSHITHNPVFAGYGGWVGTGAGALTGLAGAHSEDSGTFKRTLAAWGAATAGTAAGMTALGWAAPALVQYGGSPILGALGQSLGATAGGVAGASACFIGADNPVADKIKATGAVTTLGIGGLYVGEALQAVAANTIGHLPVAVQAAAPLVTAATGAVLGFQLYANANDTYNGESTYNYHTGQTIPAKPPTPEEQKAKNLSDISNVASATSIGATLGMAAGAVIGEVAHNVGGNYAYACITPFVGAATGAAIGFGTQTNTTVPLLAAGAAGATVAGTLIGDAVGQGLTALTGSSIYSAVGAAVGGATGASVGANVLGEKFKGVGEIAKYTTPAIGGAALGVTLGALTGELLTHITGAHISPVVAPALLGLAGSLSSVAAVVNYKPAPAKSNA